MWTQSQQEAPRQQSGKGAATTAEDPGHRRWPHGARTLRYPKARGTHPPGSWQDPGLDQVRARWGEGGEKPALGELGPSPQARSLGGDVAADAALHCSTSLRCCCGRVGLWGFSMKLRPNDWG